jgi:branched-chain amino acid aminotransferase
MIKTTEFKIVRSESSKLKNLDIENIPFGKYFSDHMLEAEYANGEWKQPVIKPYGPIQITPSNSALHYGQSIFEGIKAYKHPNGEAYIFRPFDNFKRFNRSAVRMQMPEVPEDFFIEGMRLLIELDVNWIPSSPDHSLYIRPFMFATEESIGVKPSDHYRFMIILSPTGPYYATPMRINVEEHFIRAVTGGVGYAKTAGNYAAAMYATAEAKKKGYDQVLWMDAIEHKYVQECGTMNIFFIIGNTAVTPDLTDGTILSGVTRDSVMTLLSEMGYEVQERKISIDEIVAAYKDGSLMEVFGSGTAATISLIKELRYKDETMLFHEDKWVASRKVKQALSAIREGHETDTHNWMFKI